MCDENVVSRIYQQVRYTDGLPGVFAKRMEQLGRIQRWMGGYFKAVAIMLQIPGGAEYRYIEDERDDQLWDLIWNPDARSALNILAATLERLGAAELLAQVPGGEAFKPRRLPVEARVHLAERDRMSLLRVAATCLDRLLVVQHIAGELESYGLVPADDEPQPEPKRRRKKRTK